MANKIQIKRGLQAAVENLVLSPGEFAVALDTGNVYIGTNAGVYHVNPPASAAETAKALETAREFSLTGDVTSAAVEFNGTQNVSLTAVLATIAGLTAGTYTKLTVNKKGIVTAGATLTNSDLPDSGVTAGTYPKVTVNAKGVVTGNAALVADDIPTISKDKVSGLGTAAAKDTGTSVGDVVIVGSDGKIDSSVLPDIAITNTFVVASQAEMLAVDAQVGDVAIRTDEGKSYILKTAGASTLANWEWLRTPDCKIQSVNGRTGAVVLTYSDVGAEAALSGSAAKTSVADGDGIVILDSAASNATKKLLWSVIKSTLKTYFDTLYNKYVLPAATSSTLGGVKVGSGLSVTFDGTVSYTLPTASSSAKGGVKVDDSTIKITDEVISVGDIDGGTF